MPIIVIYKGVHDAKKVYDFLYSLKQFFDSKGVQNDALSINSSSIYLQDVHRCDSVVSLVTRVKAFTQL